jgi:class 3 adenylate cyclase/WD40 repeat protein/energy-coupling factor transporter ATP-binding protein EcfA2
VSPAPTPPAQQLTFVFTDIEGSTRLLEQLHDRYAEVLAIHGRLIGDAAARAGGEIVDTQGDAFFLVFRTVDQAVAFAVDSQHALADQRWPGDTELRVRMGIHSGEATPNAGGYVGLDVHRAARISSAAHGGQVLVSAAAADGLGNGHRLKALGAHQLKDFAAPIALHQLLVDGLPADFAPPRSLEDPDQPPAPGEPPYQGLAHFEEADAPRFFGREKLVARLVGRLEEQSFLAVIGASGSGKSSLVRAGLVPALRRQGVTNVVLLTPTAEPFAALAAALAPEAGAQARAELAQRLRFGPDALTERLGKGSLLVVDQAEELFSLCRDEGERTVFIEHLLAATEAGGRVVLTLRADFYDRLAGYPALRDLVAARQEYLGQMSSAELRAAIEGPAGAGGWRFDAGLVDLILHDVGTEPGALPLLSHALLETWQRRRGRLMMLRGYLESGGVQAAIARSADRLMAELQPEQQLIARTIFLRLTEFGAGTPDTRRRADLAELLGRTDDAGADVLHRLAERRLVVIGEDTAEVAHEALIREWPTLREWLAADREALRLHRSLTEAATEWQRAGREPSLLFRGGRLVAALDWAQGHEAEPNALEREFIEESRVASEHEAQRQRATNRRLRMLLAGAGVFLVLAVAAGTYAVLEADRAEQAAVDARARELTMSALAVMEENPSLSMALLVAASDIREPSLETLELMHRAVNESRILGRYEWPADKEIGNDMWIDLHPSGELMLASPWLPVPPGPNNYMEVADAYGGSAVWLWELEEESAGFGQAFFTPDGKHVIVGVHWWEPHRDRPAAVPSNEVGLHVLDAYTGESISQLDLGHCGGFVRGVSDTRALVDTAAISSGHCAWDPEENIELEWIDLASGRRALITGGIRGPHSVLSGDGRVAAYDVGDPMLTVVRDLETGFECHISKQSDQIDRRLWSLNHDGSLLLHGSQPIAVWDVADVARCERLPQSFDQHAGPANAAIFDASDGSVYSAGPDGRLLHWDAASTGLIDAQAGVGSGSFLAGASDFLLVGSSETLSAVLVRRDSSAAPLNVRDSGDYWRPPGADLPCYLLIDGVLVSNGVALVSDTCGGSVGEQKTIAVDTSSMTIRYALHGGGGQRVAMSPDGTRFARQEQTDFLSGPLMVRDVFSGEEVVELQGICSNDLNTEDPIAGGADCAAYPETPFAHWSWDIKWSPNGSLIASLGMPGDPARVAVWDSATGGLLPAPTLDSTSQGWSVLFSPDSQNIIVANMDGSMESISTADWTVTTTGRVDGRDPLLTGISALGEVVVVGAGASVHWFDPETLQPSRPSVLGDQSGSVRATAPSPDGLLLATVSSDGVLRVLDATNGQLRDRVNFGRVEAKGVAFIDDQRVAVGLADGTLHTVTIDPTTLIREAKESLTRTFTDAECERFGFEQCPTLEELRAP